MSCVYRWQRYLVRDTRDMGAGWAATTTEFDLYRTGGRTARRAPVARTSHEGEVAARAHAPATLQAP
jgi:hypothetical protein